MQTLKTAFLDDVYIVSVNEKSPGSFIKKKSAIKTSNKFIFGVIILGLFIVFTLSIIAPDLSQV